MENQFYTLFIAMVVWCRSLCFRKRLTSGTNGRIDGIKSFDGAPIAMENILKSYNILSARVLSQRI
jgi:hypothetical protein